MQSDLYMLSESPKSRYSKKSKGGGLRNKLTESEQQKPMPLK